MRLRKLLDQSAFAYWALLGPSWSFLVLLGPYSWSIWVLLDPSGSIWVVTNGHYDLLGSQIVQLDIWYTVYRFLCLELSSCPKLAMLLLTLLRLMIEVPGAAVSCRPAPASKHFIMAALTICDCYLAIICYAPPCARLT